MRDIAEITGLGKPMVQRILKSDLKMSRASARWVPRLLSEDDCGHNLARYNCKLSDVIDNLNDMRQWVRPIAGKISAQNSLLANLSQRLIGELKGYPWSGVRRLSGVCLSSVCLSSVHNFKCLLL